MADDGFKLTVDPRPEVFIGKVSRFSQRAQNDAEELPRQAAVFLQHAVRRRVQGRPGPRRVSGDYWRSIVVEESKQRRIRYTTTWTVTTDHPAARRLEYGFVGRDAMGRTYHQRPLPHWRPAVEEARRQFFRQSAIAARKWWR